MARPKSASFTAAPLHLLARSRFSGYRERAFTPRAVVRRGAQNREVGRLLDCPRPIAGFVSGDKAGSPSFRGKLALSLNVDTLLPKAGTESPVRPHRQHNCSAWGCRAAPLERPVSPLSSLTGWRVQALGQWSSQDMVEHPCPTQLQSALLHGTESCLHPQVGDASSWTVVLGSAGGIFVLS